MKQTVALYTTIPELLEDLIRESHNEPTNLIVCSTKDDFLHQLVPSLRNHTSTPPEIPSSQDEEDSIEQDASASPLHPILHPTLTNLAATKSIHLTFCPTINTLRAYLASTSTAPIITILLNAIALHHATSEFSVQGLSRTLALAVSSATSRSIKKLRLVECHDMHDPSNPAFGARLWDARIPLLSGSVRLASEGASWAGRVISVRRIAGRWFKFEEGNAKDGGTDPEDEMLI